jgi:glycine/D-amino acid oxidase-like deaminating enzyme/nitrite reductase/ring-hydroxylating ferredoxin subunit
VRLLAIAHDSRDWNEGKNMPSPWWNTTATTRYPRLERPLELDVAVIGAGITGLTAAFRLARAGRRVAVLELSTVGAGSTGDSTGHLTACLDTSYAELISRFGEDGAQIAAQSSMEAIDFIERTVAELAIECDFMRTPGFRFSQTAEAASSLMHEATLTRKLGLATSFSHETALPLATTGCLRFENQAQFDAPRYCQALAAALPDAVYGDTLVESVDAGTPCVVRAGGQVVTASAVIMASHVPINRVPALQGQLSPYTSYTMAFALGGSRFPEGLYWDTEEPYHYIRLVRDKDRQLLLIGGEDHRTGQEPDTNGRFDALEAYARKNFDLQSVEYHGSGQVFASADGLPYIGCLPGMTNVQVATGLAGTGLTFGTVAGILMADITLERANPWKELYRPSRVKSVSTPKRPKKSPDRSKNAAPGRWPDLPVGEGRVAEIEGEKVALYRDQRASLHVLSASCTHMGCVVQWNGAARSWDCPCHGGRYRPTGEVLCAPPTQSLRPLREGIIRQSEN